MKNAVFWFARPRGSIRAAYITQYSGSKIKPSKTCRNQAVIELNTISIILIDVSVK
jgi:hypothetical protein